MWNLIWLANFITVVRSKHFVHYTGTPIGTWHDSWSLVAQTVKNLPAVQETWVWSLGEKELFEKGKASHSSILAWRSPWTVVHGVTKSRTRLSDWTAEYSGQFGSLLPCSESKRVSSSVVSDSLQPHGLKPSRLPVHGILQARILEWVSIPFSRRSSQPRDWIRASYLAGRFFTILERPILFKGIYSSRKVDLNSRGGSI